MQKKKLGFLALAAVAALGLASCDNTNVTNEAKNGTVRINLNYNGANGITFREVESYYNKIENATYTQGALLPTWQAFSEILQLNLVDVADYNSKKDNDNYDKVKTDNFLAADGKGIDLFYNSLANIKKMANEGNALDLLTFLKQGKMPHFARYLSDNPEILDMCCVYDNDGNPHLYYTPYFDGYQQIERMFIMDTEMIERLLDSETAGDVAPAIGEGRLNGAYYKPFMDANYNYKDANTKISVLNEKDEVVEVEVVQTENIIKQQNALLGTEGTTGKQLLQQLQAYLKTAYPTYTKLSDIYASQSAIYNADELIALMRVVRANPATASGISSCTTVEVLMPREDGANRLENILDFAEIWGVNGLDAESNNMFFDGNGKLNVFGAMQASYDALTLLNQIYNEGLIIKDFQKVGATKTTLKYVNSYWKSTASNAGAGFMLYDYCASTTVGNDKDSNGIGTNPTDRKGIYANIENGFSKQGIRPVLAPVSYWNTSYEAVDTDHLFDENGVCVNRDIKSLVRFSDSNRALKNNSWCIPKTAENVDGALKLMDYLYSAEGSYINDFGPVKYQGNYTNSIIYGEWVPTLSSTLIDMYLASGKDFWTYMRKYVGATNGIGSVRSDALDMQVTNAYAQVGLKNVQKAIKTGVMTLATCSNTYGWSTCVPTNWKVSANSSDAKKYEKLTTFWDANGTGDSGWRAVVVAPINSNLEDVSVAAGTKFSDVKTERQAYAKSYLSVFSNSILATPTWLTNLLSGEKTN